MAEHSFQEENINIGLIHERTHNCTILTEEELKEECDSILKKTQHVEKLIHKQLMSVQTLNLKAPNSYNHIRYCLSIVRSIYLPSPKNVFIAVFLGLITFSCLAFILCISSCNYSSNTLINPSLQYTLEYYFPNLAINNTIVPA